MKVHIKEFSVDMQVKSNGIEFEVRSADDKEQLGDCYLTMTGLIWCSGKTNKENGIKIGWREFITIMTSDETLKAALKAAKDAAK